MQAHIDFCKLSPFSILRTGLQYAKANQMPASGDSSSDLQPLETFRMRTTEEQIISVDRIWESISVLEVSECFHIGMKMLTFKSIFYIADENADFLIHDINSARLWHSASLNLISQNSPRIFDRPRNYCGTWHENSVELSSEPLLRDA